ncbi:hypothetical protein [Microcoleus vaginatus]|uniref:hypothetical protein n=1 Tax=Microcoleus vaginatus TaxID=119532 RepID=UPI001F621AA1|nr:hypothetical protein D0A37_14150 [Microcoleus vaginatus HSN003]
MSFTSRHLSRRNFQLFDSQSTVNSQQSTSCLSATGIDITWSFLTYKLKSPIENLKSIDRTHKKIGAIPDIPRITPIIDFKL